VLPRNAKPRAGGFDLVRIDLNVNVSNTCWSERPQARFEEPLLAVSVSSEPADELTSRRGARPHLPAAFGDFSGFTLAP